MQTESNPPRQKDPRRIWTDCPACARKHLTAAYAFLNSESLYRSGQTTNLQVLTARAGIALVEWATGYDGNRALAIGCLAAAETSPDGNSAHIGMIRALRLQIEKGIDAEEALAGYRKSFNPTPAANILAHIAEAHRELPGELDDLLLREDFSDLGEKLLDAILYIENTYELGAPQRPAQNQEPHAIVL